MYIGETEELLARLGQHSASLKQNKHDCRELQEDWNQFGKKTLLLRLFALEMPIRHKLCDVKKKKVL